MSFRNRIVDLRQVPARELRAHPQNWRQHPEAQQSALRGLLAEVGWAQAVVARELETGELQIIDGHLRADVADDAEVPVLVLDVDEAEAAKLLASMDPLAAMAEASAEALADLLGTVETESEGLQSLLEDLARENRVQVYQPDEGAAAAAAGEEDDELAPAMTLAERWGVAEGQVWRIRAAPAAAGRLLPRETMDVNLVTGKRETDLSASVELKPDQVALALKRAKKAGLEVEQIT